MKNNYQGELFAIVAALSYSSFGVFSRLIKDDFDPIFQTFSRALPITVLSLFLLVVTSRGKVTFQFKNCKLEWVISILTGSIINVFFFLSSVHLPLGISMFLFYGASLVVTYACSTIIHHEALDIKEKAALYIALLGMGILNINLFSTVEIMYVTFPLIAGTCFGLEHNMNKVLSRSNSPFFISAINHFASFFILIPFLFLFHQSYNWDFSSKAWVINILYALFGMIAMVTTVIAFNVTKASKANLLLLSELIFVSIIGYLFYDEIFSVAELIGCGVIFVALISPYISFNRGAR